MRSGLVLLLVCIVVSSFSGCVTTRQSAPMPDLNMAIDDASMARIYVVRPAGVGTAVPFNIYENGVHMGVLGTNSFLCWERDPGLIEVSAKSENESKVSLQVESGNAYYIKASPRMGLLKARVHLETTDVSTGMKLVGKC